MNTNEKYFLNSSHAALSSFQSSGRITSRYAVRLRSPNARLRLALCIRKRYMNSQPVHFNRPRAYKKKDKGRKQMKNQITSPKRVRNNANLLGFYVAILTTVLTVVTFGIAIFTPPISGSFCQGSCIEYPFMCVRLSNPSIHQPLSIDIWIASLAEVNVV